MIDVIEHGLQLSTRKRHRKSIDRKYLTRKPQAVVETFDGKKFKFTHTDESEVVRQNLDKVVTAGKSVLRSEQIQLTGSLKVRKQVYQETTTLSDRKIEQDRRNGNSPVLKIDSAMSLSISLTPSRNRKWRPATTKELGISPSGKIQKQTSGKTKLCSKENFSRIRTFFEPALQLKVSTYLTNINPLATQDQVRDAQPTNGTPGELNTTDHVTGNWKLIGPIEEIGNLGSQSDNLLILDDLNF